MWDTPHTRGQEHSSTVSHLPLVQNGPTQGSINATHNQAKKKGETQV